MTPNNTRTHEAQILPRVVSEVGEAERLIEREPGVALAFGQDELLIERRPLAVKVVPPPAVIISAVAQRYDACGIERDPEFLAQLATPGGEESAAIRGLATPTEAGPLARVRGLSASRRCSSTLPEAT
jgi:hypothetical protein